jgi:hypothetical protein
MRASHPGSNSTIEVISFASGTLVLLTDDRLRRGLERFGDLQLDVDPMIRETRSQDGPLFVFPAGGREFRPRLGERYLLIYWR